MLVSDISKEPDLPLGHKHGDAERVDGRISEPLVVKASTPIEPVKVALVGFAPEEAQITNLKVGKELTVVVVTSVARVQQPAQIRLGVDQLGMVIDKSTGPRP